MICEQALVGNLLQLNIILSYSGSCDYQNAMCKYDVWEGLKNSLRKLSIIPVTIQFDDDQYKTVDIKICNITEITSKKSLTNLEKS
jgi:hypothetical protein